MRQIQARIRTKAVCSTVISQKKMSIHTHGMSKKQIYHIRYRAKKKAAEDTCVRPSKSEIQAVGEEVLQPNDLKSILKSVYMVRRKTCPPLPKSREEVHQALFVLANGGGINSSQVYR